MITERIFELRQIKECKSILHDREREIASPILDNKEQLSVIYDTVKDECLNNKSLTKYEVKYYFVAIASFLYTPKAWMGESFERGVRDRIAIVLGYAPSHISNTFRIVTDWFVIYKDFREGVEYLYDKVVNELMS